MDCWDRGVGRTAHPKIFQLFVGLSREVTTDLELVPVPFHQQAPAVSSLACTLLHEFGLASTT